MATPVAGVVHLYPGGRALLELAVAPFANAAAGGQWTPGAPAEDQVVQVAKAPPSPAEVAQRVRQGDLPTAPSRQGVTTAQVTVGLAAKT